MKKVVLFLLALIPALASADPITLEPQACNAYCTCSTVAYNYAYPGAPQITVLGDVSYQSPAIVNFDGTDYQITTPDGRFSGSFHRWVTKTTSGRVAGARIQHCAFNGGELR